MNVCQGYETFVAELLSIGKANYKAAYFSDFKHTNRYYENLNYASPTACMPFLYSQISVQLLLQFYSFHSTHCQLKKLMGNRDHLLLN